MGIVALVRVNANGSPDATFGSGGLVTVDMGGTDIAYDVTLQPDGKIVAVGTNGDDLAVVRLNPNGSPDATFGTGGKAFYGDSYTPEVGNSVVVQPDGKVLVGGEDNGDWLLVRFTAAGAADPTFGTSNTTGDTTVDLGGSERIRGIALQGDGKIVVTGNRGGDGRANDLAVARFVADPAPAVRRLYAMQDANYNVTALADEGGTVVERYLYDPYGAVTVLNADGTPRAGGSAYGWQYLFQGLRLDGGSGLLEARGRYDSPTLGRWTKQDPAGYVDGANRYQDVSGDPIDNLDPSGLRLYKGRSKWGGFTHAYIWDSTTGEYYEMNGSSGTPSDEHRFDTENQQRGPTDTCPADNTWRDFDTDGKARRDVTPILNEDGSELTPEQEQKIKDYMKGWKKGHPWVPYFSDCHTAVNQAIASAKAKVPGHTGRRDPIKQ